MAYPATADGPVGGYRSLNQGSFPALNRVRLLLLCPCLCPTLMHAPYPLYSRDTELFMPFYQGPYGNYF